MIKSSFVKSEKGKAKEDVNRAYFGHAELDGVLGNSLRKGTLILVEEDYPTSMHVSLNRYFIGSGYHREEKCMIYDVFAQRWEEMVPVRSTREERRQMEKLQQQEKSSIPSQIAWRYNTMTIKLTEEALSKDIPRLDLSRNVADLQQIRKWMISKNLNEFGTLRSLFDDLCATLQSCCTSEQDISLKKICITNLFGNFSKVNRQKQSDIVKFVHALKTLARSAHVLVVLTIPPSMEEQLKSLFYLNFDLVIKLEPLFDNSQFLDFNGIMHILKYPQLNNYLNFKLDTLTWGLKASSKKRIEILKLYLQPPQQDNINADNQYQQEQKTQTIICSNKPSANNQLDF